MYTLNMLPKPKFSFFIRFALRLGVPFFFLFFSFFFFGSFLFFETQQGWQQIYFKHLTIQSTLYTLNT